MSLLTYAYNPNQTVATLVEAMQAGQRRQAQQEALMASVSRTIADDQRRADEFNRVQSFNEAKNAEEVARYGRKEAEDRRRYDQDNALFSVPSVPTDVASTPGVGTEPTQAQLSIPSIDQPPGETESVDLYNAGGPVPPSRSLLTGDEPKEADRLFTESLARKRAAQLQAQLKAINGNPEAVADGAPGQVAEAADQAQTEVAGIDAARQYAPPDLSGGDFSLASVSRPDPFKPAEADPFGADPLATPNLASIGAPAGAPPRADGLPAGAGEPANGPDQLIPPRPGQQTADYIGGLQRAGIPVRRKDIPGLVRTGMSAELRKTGTAATAQSEAELTRGFTFNPEHNTYRKPDGAEVFVDRSASGKIILKSFRPTEVKASRWVQGSDGQGYALGSNGEPMKPIPEGVTLNFNPSKPITRNDNLGNVYVLHPDGTQELAIPAKAKMTAKESSDYTKLLAERNAAGAILDGISDAEKKTWYGATKKEVKEAETRVRDADASIKAFRERYPTLTTPAPAAAPAAPGGGAPAIKPEEKAASLANAKAAAEKKPDAIPAIRERLLAAGFTEQELQAEGL